MIVIPFQPVDPLLVAERLRQLPQFTFLDSAMAHAETGRYAFLAADPFGSFRVLDGRVLWNADEIVPAAGDRRPLGQRALDELGRRLGRYRQEHAPGLPPFQTGAAGYIAYDFGRLLETVRGAPPPPTGIADLELHFYDVIVALDLAGDRAFVIASGWPETDPAAQRRRARVRAEAMLARIEAPIAVAPAVAVAADAVVTASLDRAGFEAAVARTRDYILAGDVFQANIARRLATELPAGFDPYAYYLALRATNPAPFAAFLDYGAVQVASSSPELLMAVGDGRITAQPIKGTAARSADAAQDARLADALAASEKDRAENAMIVDLLRSDLSRVCEPHSVRVPRLAAVESFASVHHLVSTVTGDLAPGMTAVEALAALFPGGSITGAPKIRAMEIIAELEQAPRGIYCGAIGFIGFDGAAAFNIAIRTATFAGGTASLGAGGGITMLSDPAAEFAETELKARKLVEAFRMAP